MLVKISPVKILSDLGYELVELETPEDYLSALMEAIVTLQNAGGSGRARADILQEELIRVRKERKKAAPSAGMKATKKTISPSKFFDKKEQKSLPMGKGEMGGAIVKVAEGVDSIVETLKAEKKQDKKHFSFLRNMAERFKRRREENKLEFKVFDGLKKTATKLLTPFKSAWSQFLEFIGKVLLGRVLFKILEWMGNEENQGKLQSIIKFFKDWWPTLLAGYLLFGTGFTSMAVGLVKAVAFGTVKLLGLIPKLVAALAKLKLGKILNRIPGGPLLKGALLLGGSIVTGLAVNKMMNQDKDNSDDNEDQEFKQGGFVSGPAGVDKVPARLTAGEFVMSKGAVQKYGTDTLAAMNAAGGGTNRPTPMGGYFGGGEVKSYKELLEKGGTVEDLNYGTMREINVSFPEKR